MIERSERTASHPRSRNLARFTLGADIAAGQDCSPGRSLSGSPCFLASCKPNRPANSHETPGRHFDRRVGCSSSTPSGLREW